MFNKSRISELECKVMRLEADLKSVDKINTQLLKQLGALTEHLDVSYQQPYMTRGKYVKKGARYEH